MLKRPKRPTCLVCKARLSGRTDKKYCSDACKSWYHRALRANTDKATTKIDAILHRNRSILLEIIGKHNDKIKIPRLDLERRKFNFTYFTHLVMNKHGKEYRYVYDLAYMTFSSDEVLIIKGGKQLH